MINHTPRRLLSLDCKHRVVVRYLDRKRAEATTVGGGQVTDNFLRQLEAFRMYGFSGIPYAPGPKTA